MTTGAWDDSRLSGTSGGRGARAAGWNVRNLWALEDNARVVAWVATRIGRTALVALFALVLVAANRGYRAEPEWPVFLVACAAACAYAPRYRPVTIFVATMAALLKQVWFPHAGLIEIIRQEGVEFLSPTGFVHGALAAFFVASWAVLGYARRNKASFVARRPVLALLAAEALLCGLALVPYVHGVARVTVWAFLTVFSAYIWFLAYALVDQRSKDPAPRLFQLGIFHPFWGSSSTPLGKGAAFLRRVQSKTPEELSVTQIKALKLLIWSLVLTALSRALAWLVEGRLQVPRLDSVQAAFFRGEPYPIALGWASLITATALGTLWLAVWGHQIVAVARLSGFRLPRNTWRPLESRTLADLWNRYYYYYKELLVEFFFVPTFLRTFKKHPRLRTFFATFMAAGVGNAVFHFVRDIDVVATRGLWGALESYTSYVFYCVMLATGIGISQLRTNAGRQAPASPLGKLRAFLCVWSFVVCLHVFANETRDYSLVQRLSFMANLFGVY